MRRRFQILRMLVVMVILLFNSQMYGQDKEGLFAPATRSDIAFSKQQSEKLDRIIANPIYLSHHFLKVKELHKVQEKGSVYVNLPDKKEAELFIGKQINFVSPNEYTFYAELAPNKEFRSGSMHLIAKEGNLFGQINIEEEIYDLQDFGKHKNVLFKIDPSLYILKMNVLWNIFQEKQRGINQVQKEKEKRKQG